MKTIGIVLLFAFVATSSTTSAQDTAAAKTTFIDREISSKNCSLAKNSTHKICAEEKK